MSSLFFKKREKNKKFKKLNKQEFKRKEKTIGGGQRTNFLVWKLVIRTKELSIYPTFPA